MSVLYTIYPMLERGQRLPREHAIKRRVTAELSFCGGMACAHEWGHTKFVLPMMIDAVEVECRGRWRLLRGTEVIHRSLHSDGPQDLYEQEWWCVPVMQTSIDQRAR